MSTTVSADRPLQVQPKLLRMLRSIKLAALVWSVLRAVLIIGIGFIVLYPLLINCVSALMPENDLYDPSVRWVPNRLTLDNIRMAWRLMEYPSAFLNSAALSLLAAALQLMSCTVIGYGFARYRIKGGSLWFSLVILTLIVPPEMTLIPQYLNFRYFDLYGLLPDGGINLIGTLWPAILTSALGMGLKSGLLIYIMRQFFKGLPQDLEDAAYVDGAGPFATFLRVMVPSAVPGLVVVFLFSVVWQWNDSLIVTMFLGGKKYLPNMLGDLARRTAIEVIGDNNQIVSPYTSIINNTGSVLVMAPLVALYIFCQRFFVETIERTGLVG